MERTWKIEDHLCVKCGGRILKCVSGNGMTPGGNHVYKCADCGVSSTKFSGRDLCWCGMTHKNQTISAYRCLPFSVIKKEPDLKTLFLKCGCDPTRGEVGIVLERDLLKYYQDKGYKI